MSILHALRACALAAIAATTITASTRAETITVTHWGSAFYGAPYAVAMAYRIRFYMEMNAREAMHLIELRSAPQGHPAYRRIAQTMHRLIAERAGHRALAAAMRFADHSEVALERLDAERAAERRRGEGFTP